MGLILALYIFNGLKSARRGALGSLEFVKVYKASAIFRALRFFPTFIEKSCVNGSTNRIKDASSGAAGFDL